MEGNTKEAITIGVTASGILGMLLAIIYTIAIYPIQLQQQESQREVKVVCNTDHFDLNFTTYCIDHNALNTTLWEMHHKQ